MTRRAPILARCSVAIVVLTILVTAIPPAGGVPPQQPLVPLPDLRRASIPDGPALQSVAELWGTGIQQARERLSLQAPAQVLADHLQGQYEETFGGVWIDNSRQGEIVLDFTAPNLVLEQAIRSAFPDASALRFSLTAQSLDELNVLADRLFAQKAQLVEILGSDFASAVLPGEDVVEVTYSPRSPRFEAAVGSLFPGAPLRFRYAEVPSGAACTSVTNCPDNPARGGLRIQSATAGCTGGFVAIRNNGDEELWSAGHCFSAGQSISTPGRTVGTVNRRYDSNNLDSLAIPLTSSWTIDNGIFRTASSPNYPIYNVNLSTSANVGATLCSVGATTTSLGQKCGPVLSSSYSYGNNNDMFSFQVCSRAGDSGGPTYSQNNYAWGIVSGATLGDGTPGSCTSSDFTISGYIAYQQFALGGGVFTG